MKRQDENQVGWARVTNKPSWVDFTAFVDVLRLSKTWNLNIHGDWMHSGCQ
jgi:hypothetical protein